MFEMRGIQDSGCKKYKNHCNQIQFTIFGFKAAIRTIMTDYLAISIFHLEIMQYFVSDMKDLDP